MQTFSYKFRDETMKYRRSGSGPALVLVHGAFYHDIWYPVRDELAKSYTVYEVDLAGFGESAVIPSATHDTELWSKQLLTFLRQVVRPHHLQDPGVRMIGFSYGTIVILEAVQRLLRLQTELSITQIDLIGLPLKMHGGWTSGVTRLPRSTRRWLMRQDWFRKKVLLPRLASIITDRSERDRLGPSFLTAMLQTDVPALADPDYFDAARRARELLLKITIPYHLYYGERDPLYQPPLLDELSIPQEKFSMIAHAGHNAMHAPDFLQYLMKS